MNSPDINESGHHKLLSLPDHVVIFSRLLRGAGLRIGTGSVIEAIAAIERLGIRNPADLETCLFAFFIQRHEYRDLFRQAFRLYWLTPDALAAIADHSSARGRGEENGEEISRRLSEQMESVSETPPESIELEFERRKSATKAERLLHKDFEAMSTEELLEAEKMLRKLRLPVEAVPSRRFSPAVRGERLDMRASLRAALRTDGVIPLRFRKRRTRQSPIVVLCDISGSMSIYSRMFLHFMHAVSNDRDRVHSFVFGTRLTNISRQLRFRDVDRALAATSNAVKDWSGGTRIEESLRSFNRQWSRRVLAQGAIVLLISDGLDRGEGAGLQKEMERLAKSSRRLIWLNPLLRYQEFEPRAAGIRAMLPYVDEFRPAHNLVSLAQLPGLLMPDAIAGAA